MTALISSLSVYLHLVAAILILASISTLWHWRQRKRSTHLTIWITILICLILGWGLMEYYAQNAEQGIVVCEDPVQKTNCVIAMHIHSIMYGGVCGEEIKMPLEHGPLDATHTHKERNKLHWHDTLSWDEQEKKLLDNTPLQLGESFQFLDMELTDSCIKIPGSPRFCTGDICPGQTTPGKLHIWRHYNQETDTGEELSSWENLNWEDNEEWKIIFE